MDYIMKNFLKLKMHYKNSVDCSCYFKKHHRKRLAPKRLYCNNATTQTEITMRQCIYFTEKNLK